MAKSWKLSNHFSAHKKIFNMGGWSYSESCIIDGEKKYKAKPHGNREKQLQTAEKINTTCWASRNIIVIRRKAKWQRQATGSRKFSCQVLIQR